MKYLRPRAFTYLNNAMLANLTSKRRVELREQSFSFPSTSGRFCKGLNVIRVLLFVLVLVYLFTHRAFLLVYFSVVPCLLHYFFSTLEARMPSANPYRLPNLCYYYLYSLSHLSIKPMISYYTMQ